MWAESGGDLVQEMQSGHPESIQVIGGEATGWWAARYQVGEPPYPQGRWLEDLVAAGFAVIGYCTSANGVTRSVLLFTHTQDPAEIASLCKWYGETTGAFLIAAPPELVRQAEAILTSQAGPVPPGSEIVPTDPGGDVTPTQPSGSWTPIADRTLAVGIGAAAAAVVLVGLGVLAVVGVLLSKKKR